VHLAVAVDFQIRPQIVNANEENIGFAIRGFYGTCADVGKQAAKKNTAPGKIPWLFWRSFYIKYASLKWKIVTRRLVVS
jgi:hypothetical protein